MDSYEKEFESAGQEARRLAIALKRNQQKTGKQLLNDTQEAAERAETYKSNCHL